MSGAGQRPDERHEARQLDALILDTIAAAQNEWTLDDATFTEVARQVFAYQCRHQPALRRFAARRGVEPEHLESWRDLPPIPTRSFKELRLATFPQSAAVRVFHSSGTTSADRSTLELDTLELYDASLLPTLQHFLIPDAAELDWLALVLAPRAAPDSSLSYMIAQAAATLGHRIDWGVDQSGLDAEVVHATLQRAETGERPLCVAGTAFAFVHLIDHLVARGSRYRLPSGSRIMETGGFKGRSRAVERRALYALLGERLGVPDAAIVSEYGMTEMGSQFYDVALRDALDTHGWDAIDRRPIAASRVKAGPPWTRTRVIDPGTLDDVADGQTGVLVHIDLTGRSSTLALLTDDVGRRRGDGFELVGRLPEAPPRGCSLLYEELRRDAGA